MKAIIYARVSTEEQGKEGYSLDAQIEACRQYCKMKGWEVVKEYKEVGSGKEKLEKRQQLMKALDLIQNGIADILIVWKLDRISRKWTSHGIKIRQKIGYNFAAIMDSVDGSTASGRFVIDIIFRIAEWESEQIGERVSLGMKKAKEAGKQVGWKKGQPRIPEWKKEKIIELYKYGATYREIKQHVHVGDGTITSTLRNAGLIK